MAEKIKGSISFFVWLVSYFFLFIFIKFFLSIHVRYEDECFQGIENPTIVVSNHKNSFDPWIIFTSVPFKVFLKLLPIRPFATKKFHNKPLLDTLSSLGIISFIYYIYNVITIPDTESFEEKTKPIINALNKKNSILIFPEGRITKDEDVGKFKKGVIYLQERTKAPILPCSIRFGNRGWFRRKAFVSFGKTFYTPKDLTEENERDYYEAREFLRKKIKILYRKTC